MSTIVWPRWYVEAGVVSVLPWRVFHEPASDGVTRLLRHHEPETRSPLESELSPSWSWETEVVRGESLRIELMRGKGVKGGCERRKSLRIEVVRADPV